MKHANVNLPLIIGQPILTWNSLNAKLSFLDRNICENLHKNAQLDYVDTLCLSELLRKFDDSDSVTKDQFQPELLNFARTWESLKTTLEGEYNTLFDTFGIICK